MLQLNNITKRYEAGEFSVDALRGVSLSFRKNEFVAILGQSGCGKTTLLNIIGGLDKYTTGDLVINGKSTKDFKDRDWDTYRNYTIGFVFQSYNLIPHQTVLQNVEIALALSGVKKAERRRRAMEALDQVGLKNMYHKRPSEMSGGQMQRVAIARAIVNNPDIILADEPTGALDTETSVQVMDILKEIAKERLVIMVTHNPELAEQYATRTVKMLDGLVISDSMPLSEQELAEQYAEQEKSAQPKEQPGKKKKERKPTLSFWTSFMLSLKNLFSKKGRTILTSFAGSIGIIGIALVYAVSTGMSGYINSVQEETLASYPLTLQQSNGDMAAMFSVFAAGAEPGGDHELDDNIYEKLAFYNLTKSMSDKTQNQNDLKSYKQHLDKQLQNPQSTLYNAVSGVHYGYDLDLQIYTKDTEGNVIKADTDELMMTLLGEIYNVDVSNVGIGTGGMAETMMNSVFGMTIWEELLPNKDGGVVNDLLKDQYDLIHGRWPSAANEIILVVDENNEIDDMTLYALGLKSTEEIEAIIKAVNSGAKPPESTAKKWSYDEVMALTYRTIFAHECYQQNGDTWYDIRDLEGGLEGLYDDQSKGMTLRITGIIRPNDEASNHMLGGTLCYTYKLVEHIINLSQDSAIASAQKANPDVDVFTGKYFKNNTISKQAKADTVTEYLNKQTDAKKHSLYVTIKTTPTDAEIEQTKQELIEKASTTEGMKEIRAELKRMMGMFSSTMANYIDTASDSQIITMLGSYAPVKAQTNKAMNYTERSPAYADDLDAELAEATINTKAEWFDIVIEFAETTYDDNLLTLGCLDLASPSSIDLYASTFENKKLIEQDIKQFNKGKAEEDQIKYTDYVGLLMSGITTIIQAITYVLIAFVSISLIVSSIMIGVITLISVQERTKEIGILRAVGASKRNVAGMFNVETVIIGFTSGVIGVLFTYLFCIPLNAILFALTGLASLKAVLPIEFALLLIGISMLLTLIAGIIPSQSASKKDPVVALRTE